MAAIPLVQRLLNWLRSIGRAPEPTPPGTRIAATVDCTLWRLNSTEPGVVAAWWVVHRGASRDLAIALINVAQLREDLARNDPRRGTDALLLTSRAAFRAELNRYLAQDSGLRRESITHIFVAAWQGRTPNAAKQYQVSPICAIPCDLQGLSFAWTAGDRFAVAITEAMARQLLRLQVRHGESWEGFVNRIDWAGWLADYARRQFGENHVLQPRRPEKNLR